MAALGMALTGSVPFSSIAVHPLHGLSDADPSTEVDVGALTANGEAVGRLALAFATISGGVPDTARAEALLENLDTPQSGDTDFDSVAAAFEAAFAAGTPAAALPRLEAALGDGVTPGQAERLRALAAPFTAQ
jgi:hypothetical protein